MPRYEFLLFVHIATAAIWVGGAAILQFFGLRAMRAPDHAVLAFAALAALLVRNGMKAQLEAAPALE